MADPIDPKDPRYIVATTRDGTRLLDLSQYLTRVTSPVGPHDRYCGIVRRPTVSDPSYITLVAYFEMPGGVVSGTGPDAIRRLLSYDTPVAPGAVRGYTYLGQPDLVGSSHPQAASALADLQSAYSEAKRNPESIFSFPKVDIGTLPKTSKCPTPLSGTPRLTPLG
jgi:hypothetical protein